MPDVQYRDVGVSLRHLGDFTIAPGRLLRSGRTPDDARFSPVPQTIVGLRSTPCVPVAGTHYLHHPFPVGCMKYDGSSPSVRLWISSALALLDSDAVSPPVLVHCAAGVDRTGMVVASILAALSVPLVTVAEEYALTDGANPRRLQQFLADLSVDGFLTSLKLHRPERFTE